VDFAALYRGERPGALATLIRLLGDFDLAEETLQEAFTVALERWPHDGAPANPASWLISTARHKAIDRIRRARNFAGKSDELARRASELLPEPAIDDEPLADDRLRLIFTCCHPALALESQVALTLKTLCGLSVDEIAHAFLTSGTTMAQRLVRAKTKIRTARIPYEVPEADHLAERLDGVLRVVYLVFNEGYAPTSGRASLRAELCQEAIRLGRLLHALLPEEREVVALVALMLLHDSRRETRFDAEDELVTLEDQDRGRWDRAAIIEGSRLAEAALRQGGAGFYALQAAIAALHAQAPRAADTDWRQIAILYALLLRTHPSPVVALNRAAAVGMAHGPEHGNRLIDELERSGALASYHFLPAAKADLLRRQGRFDAAAASYRAALRCATNEAERRYLERRLREVTTGV
jgi:RNA polymerase sigma-70 factor (ECF subfamily)